MRRLYTLLSITVLLCSCAPQQKKDDNTFTVLCSTFPIYQLTRNITLDIEGVETKLLLPAQLGCPHDYALTPQDMHKLAKADVMVVNGLGLEEFLGTPVDKANNTLQIIDSSNGIANIIGEPNHAHHHDSNESDQCSGHHSANPHLFANPATAAQLVRNIAAQLIVQDEKNTELYLKNGRLYAQKLDTLAEEFAALKNTLKNNRIVQPHGIFDYLARSLDLEIVAILQPHGQEPSVAEMMNLTKTIRATKPAGIFIDPQTSPKVANTLAKETGCSVYRLDPNATGPEDPPLDYYETTMKENLRVLETALGQ